MPNFPGLVKTHFANWPLNLNLNETPLPTPEAKMLTSGLTNTPITKVLLIYTIASAVVLSIFDIKYLAVIHISPHFWPYAQFWRALAWQVGFANSTEALFAAMLVYHMRVVERAWGKRKMATFILTTLPYTSLLPPLLLTILRPLSFNNLNYLPSGPTSIIFALLAQYHATIPYTFRYSVGTSSSKDAGAGADADANGGADAHSKRTPSLTLLLSDKSTTYIVASQLALSQFPAMLLPAAVGWTVGVAWRAELLPGLSSGSSGFRVPAWVVGEQERRAGPSGSGERERYEDLRRRMEGEVATASGMEGSGQAQRRGAGEGNGLVDRLRGVL